MPIERIKIESHEHGLSKHRESDVTASVAGALLGIHPYMTAYHLYSLKKKLIDDDPEESESMRRGRLLEPVGVQILREDKPGWIIHDYPVGYYYRDPESRIGATPDVLVTDEHGKPGIVQIKSVEPSIFRRDWRQEDGSVEPPLWIVIQAVIEAHVTGAEWAAVAPLAVGFGLDMPIVPVPIHAGILERIKSEVATFWRRVEANEPYPVNYNLDGALVAQLYHPKDGREIDLSGDNELPHYVNQLESARGEKRMAEKFEKEAKTFITAKMGEASIARLADGRRISRKTQTNPGYVVEPFNYPVIKILKAASRI